MDRKSLIGAKIFGVIFILLAVFLINLPLGVLAAYSPSNQLYPSRTIYRSYQNRISYLEDFQIKNSTLASSANQILFAKQFAQFKQEAETFRRDFIVHGRIPLHTQIFISVGFMTCLVFVIGGFGLILNFLWARQLALWSMLLSFLFYLAFLFDLYSLLNFSNIMNKGVVTLEAILIPSAIDQLKFLLQDNFKLVFLNPAMWLMPLPLVLYALCVIYYFTRPKVKERFK